MSRKVSLTVLVVLLVVTLLSAGYLALQTQAAEQEAAEAAGVVESFYRWYLGYPGNPYAEQAYRQSPLVTAAFVAEMDAAMEAMRAAGPGGADLFCSSACLATMICARRGGRIIRRGRVAPGKMVSMFPGQVTRGEVAEGV